MKSRFILFQLGVISFFLFFNQASSAAADPKTGKVIGQVVWVKGVVQAVAQNATPRKLQRRSSIFEKDLIITDKQSTGEIVFSDNSIVALREDTQFRIDNYSFGKDVPANQSRFVASIVKGGFRTVTGLIPKNNPTNYQVNTPVATIAVQGTEFSVVYRGQLWVKYTSGKPCVKNAQGTLCLNSKTVFTNVQSADSPPVRSESANIFEGDIEITPASFNSTLSPGNDSNTNGPGAPGVSPGGGSGGQGGGKSGVVSGFCIG